MKDFLCFVKETQIQFRQINVIIPKIDVTKIILNGLPNNYQGLVHFLSMQVVLPSFKEAMSKLFLEENRWKLRLGKNNTMNPSLLKPKDLQHEDDNPKMMSFHQLGFQQYDEIL
jgi:hypothetical protein